MSLYQNPSHFKISEINTCLFIIYFYIPLNVTNIYNLSNSQIPSILPKLLDYVDIVFFKLVPAISGYNIFRVPEKFWDNNKVLTDILCGLSISVSNLENVVDIWLPGLLFLSEDFQEVLLDQTILPWKEFTDFCLLWLPITYF